MPNEPDTLAYTNCDQEIGNPHLTIGGAWPGGHVEGITYARHIAEVTNGNLGLHSGIVPGENPALGAACNGIQIRLLVDCPADFDGDGVVGAADLAIMLGAWGTNGADLNGDRTTNAADLALLLGAWGGC